MTQLFSLFVRPLCRSKFIQEDQVRKEMVQKLITHAANESIKLFKNSPSFLNLPLDNYSTAMFDLFEIEHDITLDEFVQMVKELLEKKNKRNSKTPNKRSRLNNNQDKDGDNNQVDCL